MNGDPRRVALAIVLIGLAGESAAQTVPPATQNPSPMVEHTRAHGRLSPERPDGRRASFEGPLGKPVDVFIPEPARTAGNPGLVVHFHGAAFVPEHAVARLKDGTILAVVNLGQGSGIYDRTFTDPAVYHALLADVRRTASAILGRTITPGPVTLAGFSAGHGAIRAILRNQAHFEQVDAVLLLDGLHTAYVPERRVLAEGGRLDETVLDVFVRFGRDAVQGRKRLVITHSEIFPGTFASTTETTDFLLNALGLRRTPVLRWGPAGMQQLSEVRDGRLLVLGYAGNSAPDHVDHFHGMPEFMEMIRKAEF